VSKTRTYLDLTDSKGHAGEPDKNRRVDGTAQKDQADKDGQVRSKCLVSEDYGAEGNGGRQADGRVDQAVKQAFEPFISAHPEAPSLFLSLRLSRSLSRPCPTTLTLLLLLPIVVEILIRRIGYLRRPVS
jgi:hypothetical protein